MLFNLFIYIVFDSSHKAAYLDR